MFTLGFLVLVIALAIIAIGVAILGVGVLGFGFLLQWIDILIAAAVIYGIINWFIKKRKG